MTHRLALAALALCSVAVSPSAEAHPFSRADDLDITFGAALQPRLSYGRSDQVALTERLGFGVRRARARISGRWGISRLEVDVDFSAMVPAGLYVAIAPAENWTVRVGYFPGAQPRGYIPTGLTKIDGVERAAINERWAAATIGGLGRDLGIDATWRNDYVYASLWLHTGFGGLDRNAANFSQSPSSHDATRGVDVNALAVSGALGFTPQDGLELGGHFGYDPSGGVVASRAPGLDRTVTTWSAFAYWGAAPGSQFLRIKAEAVGIMISGEGLPVDGAPVPEVDLSQFGAAATAAIGLIPHGEFFARFEIFDEDDDNDLTRYLAAGVMFSLSDMDGGPFERERLTLSYSNAARGDDTDHFAVLQGQWLF